jgi:hypothetical protein
MSKNATLLIFHKFMNFLLKNVNCNTVKLTKTIYSKHSNKDYNASFLLICYTVFYMYCTTST